MKKLFFAAASLVLLATSCGSYTYTATEANVNTVVSSATVADLEVGDRVTFTYNPTSKERKGIKNCKAAAIQAMLKANGNADVIVAPEYKYTNDMKTIVVSGRPGKYKNFRSAN